MRLAMIRRLLGLGGFSRFALVSGVECVSIATLAGALIQFDGDEAAGPLGLMLVWVAPALVIGFLGRNWIALGLPLLGFAALFSYGISSENYGNEAWAFDLAAIHIAELVACGAGVHQGRRWWRELSEPSRLPAVLDRRPEAM